MLPDELFRYKRQSNFGESRDSPLSYPKKFAIPKIIDTLKGLPTKTFGTVRQMFLTKNRETPYPHSPPLSSPQTFLLPAISNSLKGSATKSFGTVKQKVFTENLDAFPPISSIYYFDTLNW